jgi:hypothetical protein
MEGSFRLKKNTNVFNILFMQYTVVMKGVVKSAHSFFPTKRWRLFYSCEASYT